MPSVWAHVRSSPSRSNPKIGSRRQGSIDARKRQRENGVGDSPFGDSIVAVGSVRLDLGAAADREGGEPYRRFDVHGRVTPIVKTKPGQALGPARGRRRER